MPKLDTTKQKVKYRHYTKRRLSNRMKPIDKKPFNGYEDLRKIELRELRRLNLQEAIRQTELLLREVTQWKK